MLTFRDYNKVCEAAFQCIDKVKIDSLPVSMDKLIDYFGIKTIPLSRYIDEGFKKEQIFKIWGNSDGVIQKSYNNNSIVMSYNDSKPIQRQRFTIAEECSHILLNHLDNKDFNIFEQRYTLEQYKQFEEEARICAGLLLFPPQFYYNNLEYLPIRDIANICNISQKCAITRVDTYNKNKTSLNYYICKYNLNKYKSYILNDLLSTS